MRDDREMTGDAGDYDERDAANKAGILVLGAIGFLLAVKLGLIKYALS